MLGYTTIRFNENGTNTSRIYGTVIIKNYLILQSTLPLETSQMIEDIKSLLDNIK